MSVDESCEKLNDALGKIVLEEDGSVVTKWIVVAEVMNVNEEMPSLWMLSSDGLTSWQSKGMLMHALDRERQATWKDDD